MLAFLDDKRIDFNGSVMLADFGSAFLETDSTRPKENPYLVVTSPERLRAKYYGLPADVWSLGCTILELVTGREIFRPKREPSSDWGAQDVLERIRERISEGKDYTL